MLDRLIGDIEEDLEAVSKIRGDEREQIVTDFEETLEGLLAAYDMLAGPPAADSDQPPGEVRLQASWQGGHVVVWAAGPRTLPENNDQLADRLEAIGGPSLGWAVHPSVPLPSGAKAEALAIPVKDALGWLVAVGGGLGRTGVGPSVVWLGRVALEAVRLVSRGAVVPALRFTKSANERLADASVKWMPAVVDEAMVKELAAAMPGPVAALITSDGRATTLAVLAAVVDAIVTAAAARLELPAPPPHINAPIDLVEAFISRLNGSAFRAPAGVAGDISRRLDVWSRTVTQPARPTLVIQLAPPDRGDAWLLSVLGPGAKGKLLPIEVALGDSKMTKPLADEMLRLERSYPVLLRAGGLRRGQVVLSQNEAWNLMTVTGPVLEGIGFEVRVPALSRRKVTPSLRLFTEIAGNSVVGANQLANVRWSVLFDDVELTAAEILRLASEARPLVQSHGRWVELDRADLKEAAAALAERASTTQLTGAEILRHGIGLEGSPLAGGVTVEGSGWATELLQRAEHVSTDPVTRPPGFDGELRAYQAQALAWLGFLDAAGLGGCLALDMGLGKTPTVLAQIARTRGNGPALVVAPPAVVGNWAAEARRFTPGVRVLVHHGASRSEDAELAAEIARADLVITTYGTAVRDVDQLSGYTWDRVVLDEAQAIKNPANETSQQLRRIPARSRIALTGTPVENGLGDLWAILDYTNPGLVGARPAFIAQMAGEGEAALRALNGILVFRRTKSEPEVAAELPDKIDELDHCTMTPEQIGLYQAVLDGLVRDVANSDAEPKQGAILAAITALKQICNHPAAYNDDG
ncbi:MAG TPA: SNF2-related protein, partial [Ilumatobacteraceae bacterium]